MSFNSESAVTCLRGGDACLWDDACQTPPSPQQLGLFEACWPHDSRASPGPASVFNFPINFQVPMQRRCFPKMEMF
jgi:hypothetical protein